MSSQKRTRKRKAQPRRVKRPATAQTAAKATGPTRSQNPGHVCPIVGIGASAGGLDALKQFFQGMPPDSGAAFVLIQHLDPTHESLTAELLGAQTQMSVVQVQRAMAVEPNHVYVIPPNKYLSVKDGTLRLTEPLEQRWMRMPVDYFLRSLAQDCKERAIGIILSGTGTDGTLGLKEVKASGGLTIAQELGTAQYDGMPRSAIASGAVDQVLALADMPKVLVGYIGHPYVCPRPAPEKSAAEGDEDKLDAVIAILRTRAKFDFGSYKKGTLSRRIHRRMSLRHIDRIKDYVDELRRDPAEVSALQKDLFINVTSFFREPESWDALQEQVIAPLVREKGRNDAIRVWVPGCATGEEAFSIGMLLIEECQRAKKACPLQIFASDVDADALDVARNSLYPESIAADVPPERLRRFFVKGEHSYRVTKELREAVIFAQQNVLSDPPFSRIDLVSCRNLMIYLEPEVQKRIRQLIHFALNDRGYLILGSAESIGARDDLFRPVSKKWHIYRRIGAARPDQTPFSLDSSRRAPALPASIAPASTGARLLAAQKIILDRYAPACVVINRKYEILHFSGPTQDYLLQPPGAPTQDLLLKAREGLHTRLRGAVHKAVNDNRAVIVHNVRVRRGKSLYPIKIRVEPVHGAQQPDGLLLVSFEDETVPPVEPTTKPPARQGRKRTVPAPTVTAEDSLVHQLESELRATREDLQSTIEELETSNEELKASNEEVMSANEELQSTNEELETSKEELQSVNEELATVNTQLEAKVGELETTNDDLNNLLANTELPALFLDTEFRIRRFTPAMTRLVRLIPSDVGRSVRDFSSILVSEELLGAAQNVLDRLTPHETEIENDGHWWVRRILPFRTESNRIEGVVITFLDFTRRKKDEEKIWLLNRQLEERVNQRTVELEAAHSRLESILAHVADGIITFTEDGAIESFNAAAEEIFGYEASGVVGKKIDQLLLWPRSAGFMTDLLARGQASVNRDISGRRKDGTLVPLDLLVNEVRMGTQRLFIASVRDLTDRKRKEKEMQDLEKTLATLSSAERQRVGLELHDHIGQLLTGTAMLARSMEQRLQSISSVDAGNAAAMVDQLQDAHRRIRDLARGLAPITATHKGLPDAFAELARNTEAIHGIPCTYQGVEDVVIDWLEACDHLYRIAQEAVTNAVRHARPRHLWISFQRNGDGLTLSVEDDGEGLPLNVENSDGIGHRIMRYRAELIGGRLDIGPGRDGGTRVRCVFPLKPATSKK
ncbi:MAG TPA: chemotaxis protein CheB [Phycisphaerae bacterium]|nr:chemotaxis protein CheB [Phycisphaerae bacterium]